MLLPRSALRNSQDVKRFFEPGPRQGDEDPQVKGVSVSRLVPNNPLNLKQHWNTKWPSRSPKFMDLRPGSL